MLQETVPDLSVETILPEVVQTLSQLVTLKLTKWTAKAEFEWNGIILEVKESTHDAGESPVLSAVFNYPDWIVDDLVSRGGNQDDASGEEYYGSLLSYIDRIGHSHTIEFASDTDDCGELVSWGVAIKVSVRLDPESGQSFIKFMTALPEMVRMFKEASGQLNSR